MWSKFVFEFGEGVIGFVNQLMNFNVIHINDSTDLMFLIMGIPYKSIHMYSAKVYLFISSFTAQYFQTKCLKSINSFPKKENQWFIMKVLYTI